MSVNGPSKIINDGLALYLDASNKKSYGGSGTSWYDLSPSKLVAVAGGTVGPTWSNSFSGIWNFTGGVVATNYSRFDVANIPSFSALSAFAWFRTSNTTDSKTIIRMDNSDFELSINGSNSSFIAAGTNWNDINVQPTLNGTDGKWHEMGLTFNGTVLNAYFDGAYVATNTRGSSTTTAAGTLRIGTRDDAYNQHYVGDIAAVRIYNRVLNGDEILKNYNYIRRKYLIL
jgi:hypothetical protein